MSLGAGIAAALAAPLVMTMGMIWWDDHWRGSSFALNLFKCQTASLLFLITVLIMSATSTKDSSHSSSITSSSSSSPEDEESQIFTARSVGFLVLSSVLGIVLGDWAWLQGLQILGAQRVILMDALKPFVAAAMGWAFLSEHLPGAALAGIVLTVAGVLLVSMQQEDKETLATPTTTTTEPATTTPATAVYSSRGTTTGILDDPEERERIPDQEDNRQDNENGPALSSSQEQGYEAAITSNPAALLSTPDHETPTSSDPIGPPTRRATPNRMPLSTSDHETPTSIDPSGPPTSRETPKRMMHLGYFMSLLNVILDTYGAVLTKDYGRRMTVWQINLIRFGSAGLIMLFISVVMYLTQSLEYHRPVDTIQGPGKNPSALESNGPNPQQHPNEEAAVGDDGEERIESSATTPWYTLPVREMTWSAWSRVLGGVLLVTFFTPTLSNYALFQISLALTLTLTSVGPLYALPLSYWMQQGQAPPNWQALLGSIMAVGGIVILAFRGSTT